jgi:hypothetical protein
LIIPLLIPITLAAARAQIPALCGPYVNVQ